MEPLISVIIPVFNVEGTLKRCVESVLHQTYRNLEIILVDDGSPDNSGAICDSYEQKYQRVKVIHQGNTGLSGARNTGLKVMKVDYVTFIDSDDAVHPEMIEILYRVMTQYEAEIVASSLSMVPANSEMDLVNRKYGWVYAGTGTDILVEIMFNRCSWEAMGKLFDVRLLNEALFIERKLYEDFHFTPRVFSRASRAVFMDYGLYYYIQNENGIMAASETAISKDLVDVIEANIEYIKLTYESNPAVYQKLFAAFVNNSLDRLKRVVLKRMYAQNKEYIYRHRTLVLQNLYEIYRNKFISLDRKIAFGISLLSVRSLSVIFRIKLLLSRIVNRRVWVLK